MILHDGQPMANGLDRGFDTGGCEWYNNIALETRNENGSWIESVTQPMEAYTCLPQ